MGIAIDTVVDCGGMADIMCSCVLAIFGHPNGSDPDKVRLQRDMSASRLVETLGNKVRLIYGDVDGLVGNIGSQKRLSYGPLMPNFHRHLAALIDLEFGQAVRI
jgi:hypothetical protein